MATPPTDTTADPYTPATPVPLAWPATPVRVYRMTGSPDDYTLTQLPNVRALSRTKREGADPGSAIFDYDWTYPDARAPKTVEQAITTGGTPPAWTVAEGDRLVIKMQNPDEEWESVFDGEVLNFRVELTPQTECVYMTAVGIAKHLWDTPIGGQIMRNADQPSIAPPENDVQTDIPCQFNPRGEPNAINDEAIKQGDTVDGVDQEYKTFLDPLVIRDPDIRAYWTLNEAARYLTWVNNPSQTYVTNIDGAALDELLVSKMPIHGTAFNPTDDTTYTAEPIRCPDTPFTGKDWPSFLKDLIGNYGFGMSFNLSDSDSAELTGIPTTTLNLFGVQDGTVKYLFIQARGQTLDRTYTNCTHAKIERDLADVANAWNVEGELAEYEASFILAPGFPMNAANAADPTAWGAYTKTNPNYESSYYDLYRLFVFDETGDGHYANGSAEESTSVPSLDAIFGADDYVHRRRRPIGDLITDSTDGTKQKWQLAISTNYTGENPGIWDGTGTWQVVNGGAELCKDRLGVRVSCFSPNEWNIGETTTSGMPFPDGMVRVVEALNSANGAAPFTLRLTCRVQGDQKMEGTAALRAASPIQRAITRSVDARDRYRKQTVSAHSLNNTTATDVVSRDDTSAAAAEASAIQMMTEAGRLNATFQLDHLTTYYDIGDRIAQIYGRNTPLRTDAGSSAENPIYPVIVEQTLNFYPEQYTELTATDAGSNYTRYQRAQRHAANPRDRRK